MAKKTVTIEFEPESEWEWALAVVEEEMGVSERYRLMNFAEYLGTNYIAAAGEELEKFKRDFMALFPKGEK